MKNTGKRAWLITWEWFSDMDRREPRVACILDPRYSEERIKTVVQALFIQGEPLTLKEMIYHGQPFRKLKQCWHPSSRGLRFGYKPHLYARIVENLRVVKDLTGNEELFWTEPEHVKLDENHEWKTIAAPREDSWKAPTCIN